MFLQAGRTRLRGKGESEVQMEPGIDPMQPARAAARSESSMNTIALTEEIAPWR